MALEAFTGVLFASIVSAIVFSKIARLQAIAHVRFSDPICIRYGSGVIHAVGIESDDEDEDVDNDGEKFSEPTMDLPCPILEFRIINLLSREK